VYHSNKHAQQDVPSCREDGNQGGRKGKNDALQVLLGSENTSRLACVCVIVEKVFGCIVQLLSEDFGVGCGHAWGAALVGEISMN